MSRTEGNNKQRIAEQLPAAAATPAPAPLEPSKAVLVNALLKMCASGPCFISMYDYDPALYGPPPATFMQLFASPRTGSLILRFLDWGSLKQGTRLCTALHRETRKVWSLSRSDCHVICANMFGDLHG